MGRSMSTRTAMWPSRVARLGQTARAYSVRETWSTTPIARRSPRRDRVVRRRSMPSGISGTRRRYPPRRGCRSVTWRRRSGRRPPLQPRRSEGALGAHEAAQRRGGAVALLAVLLPEGVQYGEDVVQPELIGPRE